MAPTSFRHVLLDIEGTTCPVTFVSEVLFPYATKRLEAFLEQNASDPIVMELLQQVEQAWEQDPDPSAQALRETETKTTNWPNPTQAAPHLVAPYLLWLIRMDRKLAPLKELQGLIWEDGYRSGALRAPLYKDVAPALERWRDAGLGMSVYSSGSVKAQQLLYQYSSAGDLRHIFSHWFDTRIGSKQESASYEMICEQLVTPCHQVLFISDSPGEVKAAQRAGLAVLYSNREQETTPQHDNGDFTTIDSFSSISLPPFSLSPTPTQSQSQSQSQSQISQPRKEH
jgi:enolase-phosphatase E1